MVHSPHFHRPFAEWQLIPDSGAEAFEQTRPTERLIGREEDFRSSQAWSRASGVVSAPTRGGRRKGKAGRLNVVVAGGKGVGKTR